VLERKWWTLLAVCAAIFMLLVDITIVNLALPDIQRDLDATFGDLQWVIDAYALTLAALMLNAGSLADKLGRKRVFVTGLVLFTASSLACALATSPLALILSRGAQGIGGAIMFSTSLALLTQEFHGRERGTAFGVWGATTGAAVAIGPLVGGALTSGLGWRWIFFVNLPVGAATMLLSVAKLGESRDPSARPIDWAGLVTLSGSLFALVLALVRGNSEGWTSGTIVGCFAAAAALLGLFVAVELLQRAPMLDLGLFRVSTFTGAQITAFTLSAAIFSLFLYLSLYLQNVLGYSAVGAGLRVLPLSLMAFAFAPPAGKLSAHLPVRLLLGGGLVLVGVALLLLEGLTSTSGWTALLPGFIVGGAGIGMTNPPLASTSVGVVSPERSGMASGVNNTFRQIGIATGIAAFGALFQHRVQASLAGALSGGPLAGRVHEIAGAVISGHGATAARALPAPLRRQVFEAARQAFVDGLNLLFVVGAIVALVGAALALALVHNRDLRAAQGHLAAGGA
jgi:EmrB/QacA subfamily drug resistance transporter